MKRTLTLLLALLLACLPGCERKKDLPVTTVVTETGEQQELPLVTVLVDNGAATEFSAFLKTVPGYDREFHVEYETLPVGYDESQRRDQELQRIHTEILAGKGPDLFLLDSQFGTTLFTNFDIATSPQAVFNFPQQAMRNHMLLPLDDYIENAEYMEWDKLNPTIMAAGRCDQGQMILPIQFNFDVVFWRPSGYGISGELPQTRQEMLDSGCGVLELAANSGWTQSVLNDFSPLVDWDKEALAFTEEQLLEKSLQGRDCWQRWMGGGYDFFSGVDGQIDESKIDLGAMSWITGILPGEAEGSFHEGTIIVPFYNDNNAITAYITNYAAINANASYPDYAFRILDRLLDLSTQRGILGYGIGYPTYMGLGSQELPFNRRKMNPQAYAQFEALLEKIDNVRFFTGLDWEALKLRWNTYLKDGVTEEEIKKAVHSSYMAMKMMLAES